MKYTSWWGGVGWGGVGVGWDGSRNPHHSGVGKEIHIIVRWGGVEWIMKSTSWWVGVE